MSEPAIAPSLDDSAPGLDPSTELALPEPTAQEKRLARQAAAAADAEEAAQSLATIGEVGSSELVPFSPQSFDAAWKLAYHLSKSGIVHDGLKNSPGAVLSVMDRGQRLGIPWSIAVQEAHCVYGKVGWPAAILAAICDTSPTFEYFEVVEADNQHATVEAKMPRWDKPRRYTVTIDDARDAGFLDGKHASGWTSKRPMPNLIAMARREAARMWDPARCAGLYTPDELEAFREERRIEVNGGVSKTALLAERLDTPAIDVPAEEVDGEPAAESKKEEVEMIGANDRHIIRDWSRRAGLDDEAVSKIVERIAGTGDLDKCPAEFAKDIQQAIKNVADRQGRK